MSKLRSDDFDSPWKEALQVFLRPFLAFFFLDIHDDIDWARGYESLDKEFQQIIRRAKVGKRLADKLFKVWLKSGEEKWILIHIEIQGDAEAAFPERMFDYNTAVWKLYRQAVVGLAVLCDEAPDWRPTSFAYGHWGCQTEIRFRIAKLLDLQGKEASLEKDHSPIAMIVLAHLKAIATRHDPLERRESKFHLVKTLLRSKLPKESIRELIRLVDWMLTLPEDLDEAFRSDVHRFEEENKMEFISIFERAGYKRGHDRGMEEGMQKGIEKGVEIGEEKGRRLGLLDAIEIELGAKFGASGLKCLKKVRGLHDLDDLRQFAKFLKDAATIREIREYLA
jgi:hypothetical protein